MVSADAQTSLYRPPAMIRDHRIDRLMMRIVSPTRRASVMPTWVRCCPGLAHRVWRRSLRVRMGLAFLTAARVAWQSHRAHQEAGLRLLV
jgi:hypothetical protein